MQILYPIFAMFALTTFVVFRLGYVRWAAVSRRQINLRFYKSYQSFDEPEPLRVLSRHLINLFETPVIFYVVAILVYVTGQISPVLLVLAWLYVLTRFVHTVIHLTSNVVLWRFRVFGLSLMIVTAMWMVLAFKLIAS